MIRLFASGLTAAALLTAGYAGLAQAQSSPANVVAADVQAGTYKLETSHARVQFAVSHFGFSTWWGDFTGATGTLKLDPKNVAASSVEVTIPADSVTTTNAKLDGELKEWFGAAEHPTITFKSTAVTQTSPTTADIVGDLTFHGVTKPVTLKARFGGAGVNPMNKAYTVGFEATGALKRSDFGVANYVPLVGDEVTLTISAPFEKQG